MRGQRIQLKVELWFTVNFKFRCCYDIHTILSSSLRRELGLLRQRSKSSVSKKSVVSSEYATFKSDLFDS